MTATADQGRAAQRFPLLERDREIRRILAAIRHPGNGRGRLFVVEGPAGIGRSRLLLEVAGRARRHGAGVLQLRLANPQDTSLPVPADPDRTLVIVDDVQSCDRAGAQRLGRCLADARKGGAVVLLALRSSEGRSTDPWATGRLRRDLGGAPAARAAVAPTGPPGARATVRD